MATVTVKITETREWSPGYGYTKFDFDAVMHQYHIFKLAKRESFIHSYTHADKVKAPSQGADD